MRPRDSQRQKLYDAETHAFGEPTNDMTLTAVQTFTDKVLSSNVLRRQYPMARIPLEAMDGRGRRRPAYIPGLNEIRIPRFARCRWLVLHEIAHHLAYDDEKAAHSWEFCACYLDLVRIYLGKPAAEKLAAAYKLKRVRYRAPRTRAMTDEQRQAARDRMLTYHAERIRA